ncbi:TPA: DUF551 domain-containing protein [Klebsiella pneumoniae]|nr:DUF551 domain-containing protein [Klebsiella pneumoniae]HBX8220933.1 DUF551 domain-containing protein [Klebsiella pneumoniae]
MTKSTITREQLEEWVAQFDEDGGCDATDRQLEALIRQSLAAMDSEPVAEVVSIYGDPEAFGEREIRPLVGIQQMPYGTKLYRHAQQPVVPEEATSDSIEILASARRRDHAVFQWDEDQRNAAADSWNACRAAILAAAPQSPGSEPATVPGKWIPVSERMPEDRISVILWDAEIGEVTSGHYSHKTQTFYHCGDAIENEITHWMPPPCAPQEVK